LNIKYNKQKQELRDDPVLDSLLNAKEFFNKNSNTIFGAAAAIVVVIGIVIGVGYFQNSRTSKARDEFGKAMVTYNDQKMTEAIDQFRQVAENYKGSVSGTMSAFMLGGILLQQGRIDEAITWYQTVEKGTGAGFINGQALEGLATCYEMKGDTAAALRNLEKALTDNRITFRRNAIRWKIALLSQSNNAERAVNLCNEIIADTLAQEYRQDAEYLKAALQGKSAG
jgi:hypothetical protein